MTSFLWLIGAVVALLGLVLAGLALFAGWTARRVESALPPLGRFIEVDGARIHYLDIGSGPAIVLVHGLAGQMRNFTHSLLGRLKSEYRVVILDRPGSGYSTRAPGASAAIGAQATTIARFIEALGLDRPLVVGHSLGGAVALSLALNHPDRVGGLALLAPVTHPPENVPPPFQGLAITSPLLRWLVAWTLAIPASIANGKSTLEAIFGPQPVPADFATRGGGLLSLRSRSFINASRDLMAANEDLADMPARYPSLVIPVGVLFGTGDRLLDPVTHGEALAAKLPSLDLELIEGGGHMILVASADRSAQFIVRMARRVAAGATPEPIT
ncbi:MAG: alpha/beta fold hydrolase [Beijerinckiaceae bacterium]